MPGDKQSRLMTVCAWLVMFLCLSTPPCIAAETVQTLRYGSSLYHYFQRDYFAAITELSAAQTLDALGPHSTNANLLLGGMALSYGMDRKAESIFFEELEDPRQGVDVERAWFFLGKLAWERGDPARSAQRLANIAPDYAGVLQEETVYLRANTALAVGDTKVARDYLSTLQADSHWRAYLAYNLGAVHARNGDWSAAITDFDSITESAPQSAELWALHDRTHTAVGYARLAAGDLEEAREAFRQVRLDGPYTSRALLGLGWSAASRDSYLEALGPWEQLATRSMIDESAREGLLALSYAYSQLGRSGLALQQYRYAGERYSEELVRLDSAIAAFRDQPLGELLGIADETDADWLFDIGILPEGEYSPYLQHLVSRHEFQVALRELRDLYHIAARLERAQQRLQVLRYVGEHQQQVWASLVEQDRRNTLVARYRALTNEQEALRQRLLAAIERSDGRLLADPGQTVRWQRLEQADHIAAGIKANTGEAVTPQLRDRLRLLRGLLIWDDSEQYNALAWRAQRDLRELDALAAETGRALERVDAVIASSGQSDFSPRISALQKRAAEQLQELAQTTARSEDTVRQLAVTELEQQGKELMRALGQSSLAIAQLHDEAMQGDHD